MSSPPQKNDIEIVAQIVKRFTEEDEYFFWNDKQFTLDGTVRLQPGEAEALDRVLDISGKKWWEEVK